MEMGISMILIVLKRQNVFRVYKFIENTKSIEFEKTNEALCQAGIGFGRFQKMLADFPVEKLHERLLIFTIHPNVLKH